MSTYAGDNHLLKVPKEPLLWHACSTEGAASSHCLWCMWANLREHRAAVCVRVGAGRPLPVGRVDSHLKDMCRAGMSQRWRVAEDPWTRVARIPCASCERPPQYRGFVSPRQLPLSSGQAWRRAHRLWGGRPAPQHLWVAKDAQPHVAVGLSTGGMDVSGTTHTRMWPMRHFCGLLLLFQIPGCAPHRQAGNGWVARPPPPTRGACRFVTRPSPSVRYRS